jgi:hypothetical protein
MKQYYEKLITLLDEGIKHNAISHEFYTTFCQTYYTNGLNESCLSLYNIIMKQDISAKKYEDIMPFDNAEKEYIHRALKTNDPVYLEYAKALSKLLKLKLIEEQTLPEAALEYATTRAKLARKYSSLTVPETNLKLPTKATTKINKMGKWKSSAVDDLARTLVELSRYVSFSSRIEV